MQNGGGGYTGEHWGLFGNTRNGHTHQGLDIFALIGTNVYACVDATVYKVRNHSGYGKTITLRIKNNNDFYAHRRNYSPQYTNQGEIIQGPNFDKTKDIFLFYAHLEKVLFNEGDKIKAGEVIARSGVSGVLGGTALHIYILKFLQLLCR